MKSLLRKAAPFLVALVVIVGLGAVVRSLLVQAPAPDARRPQEVTLLKPPPPPPPPKDQPPPPPEVKKEVDIPEPAPAPDQPPQAANEPPPGEALGLDADGSASGDGFGLAARRGGRDLLTTGGGDGEAWVAREIDRRLSDALAADEQLRRKRFKVPVRIELAPDGSVRHVELLASTGDRDTDALLAARISTVRLSAPLPSGVNNVLRVRVGSV
jgi:protein TonB